MIKVVKAVKIVGFIETQGSPLHVLFIQFHDFETPKNYKVVKVVKVVGFIET